MGLTYTDETKEARFQYTNREGNRRVLYLGKMSKREAEHHTTFLEKVLSCHLSPSLPMDKQTAVYLEELPVRIKNMLIKHGLIRPTVEETKNLSLSLGELIEKYLVFHKEDKPNSYKNIKLGCDKLLLRFGPDKKIHDITPTEINHFEKFLYREYAEATASRLVKRFRQLMKWAIENGFFKENIFRAMRVGKQENKERLEYVPVEKVQRAMSVCVNFELRLALFLARHMAFRTPSEANSWRWSYIDFEGKRVKVLDIKRNECRVLPLFEQLYPVVAELLLQKGCESFVKDLQKVWHNPQEALSNWGQYGQVVEKLLKSKGARYITEMISRFSKEEDFVFSPEFRQRKSRTNQMKKLKGKAKVTWQKDFQNLRASCESEWIREYDIHTATMWTGNSIEVAQRHYFMITPDIWDKATGETAPEGKLKETLRSLVKAFGLEKLKAALDEIIKESES